MLPGDADEDELVTPYNVRAVPSYVLVDRSGKEVARGLGAALEMAKKAEP